MLAIKVPLEFSRVTINTPVGSDKSYAINICYAHDKTIKNLLSEGLLPFYRAKPLYRTKFFIARRAYYFMKKIFLSEKEWAIRLVISENLLLQDTDIPRILKKAAIIIAAHDC